uniref:Uncharacterized protein n=1 Tax=Anguilla anguilla TaxID=7936 RepID=A0A0E9QKQ8_ANGAN
MRPLCVWDHCQLGLLLLFSPLMQMQTYATP